MAKAKAKKVEEAKKEVDPVAYRSLEPEPEVNYTQVAVGYMQEAYNLKDMLNDKVKDDNYDPDFHIARRYKELKGLLAGLMVDGKVPVTYEGKENATSALCLGGFRFTSRMQDGRKSLVQEKLVQELLGEGLKINVIMGVIERATKQGEPFQVNEVDLEK